MVRLTERETLRLNECATICPPHQGISSFGQSNMTLIRNWQVQIIVHILGIVLKISSYEQWKCLYQSSALQLFVCYYLTGLT